MTRDEIDRALRAYLAEAGLNHYQLAWSSNPAELKVLIGNDEKSMKISTRLMTGRRLKEARTVIQTWGRLQEKHRAEVRARGRE